MAIGDYNINMVRYGRRSFRRPTYKRRQNRRFTKARRSNFKGGKFRMRMKRGMGMKGWQKFTWFENIKAADNIDTAYYGQLVLGPLDYTQDPVRAGPITQHDPDSRLSWYGPDGLIAGNLDGDGNCTVIGTGMLREVNRRDAAIDADRWDYSGVTVTHNTIVTKWNALNNGGGLVAVPASQAYFKGLKINLLGRHPNHPGMMFIGTRKDINHPYKLREQMGKIKAYIPTRKQAAGVGTVAGYAVFWDLPPIQLGGVIGTRIRYTAYYKVKFGTIG